MIEFWQFINHNNKFWLAPIVIVLVMRGVLLAVVGSSALAPFIYAVAHLIGAGDSGVHHDSF
jgi:hypothetical protein